MPQKITKKEIERWLCNRIATKQGICPEDVDIKAPWSVIINSLELFDTLAEFMIWMGFWIDPQIVNSCTNISELANYYKNLERRIT